MKMTKYPQGLFSWVDLMIRDAARAKRFYGDLFTWSGDDTPGEAGPYTMFFRNGEPVAGMGELTAEMKAGGAPAHWNSYVTVEDADVMAARAARLGGDVVMPVTRIMTAGRMAILSDPAGASFSIWEPGEHAGAALVNEPGALCWNELITTDVAKATAYYADLFGWSYVAHDMPMGTYSEIKVGERSNGGIMARPPQMAGVPPHWGVYFAVEDCDRAVARVRALGGRALGDPMDIEAGRFCAVADDQGVAFSVMRLAG